MPAVGGYSSTHVMKNLLKLLNQSFCEFKFNEYMNRSSMVKSAIGRLKGDELAQYNLWLIILKIQLIYTPR